MNPDSRFPSLQTGHLLLRAPTRDDVAAYHAILSLREVTRYSSLPDAPSYERSRKFVKWMVGLHPERKGCAWIMESLATRALVGAIRIDRMDRRSRRGTIGYEMHPAWWGRGLMSEALGALIGCAHTHFELNRLEAWTLDGNGASDKVLIKNGFRYEGTLRQRSRFKGAFHDLRMFGHLADDPPPASSASADRPVSSLASAHDRLGIGAATEPGDALSREPAPSRRVRVRE